VIDQRERDLLHDLGNALHVICGFAELVAARPELNQESMRDLREIHANAQRAIVLFRQLLKLRLP
jgi:hypothetical protein